MNLLGHGTHIVVAVDVVPPPLRKGHDRAAGPEDGKREDEQGRQAGAVEGARDEVAVVPEDARAVVAQVVLHDEARDDPAEDDAGLRLVVGDVALV